MNNEEIFAKRAQVIAKDQEKKSWSENAMANITDMRSGIKDVVIFASYGNGSHHAFRVKVSNILGKMSKDTFSVGLEGKIFVGECKLSNTQLKEIVQWIRLNKEPLLAYWKGDIMDTFDFLSKLKKVSTVQKKDK